MDDNYSPSELEYRISHWLEYYPTTGITNHLTISYTSDKYDGLENRILKKREQEGR